MRILFDQGTRVPLRHALSADKVETAFEMGWSTLQNGDLLSAAESQFDVFITTDHNLQDQQNLAGRRLAILVLPCANWPKLRRHIPTIVTAVDALSPGAFVNLVLG